MQLRRFNAQFNIALCAICALLTFTGCAKSENREDVILVYDINRDCTHLVPDEFALPNTDDYTSECVGACLNRMIAGADALDALGAIGKDLGDITYRIEGDNVNVDFGREYYNSTITRRTLQRAAVVRTLCQIEGVKGVTFTVCGEPILDTKGQAIGVMNEDSFLENDGAMINAYEKALLKLYFANESGDKLSAEMRNVIYSSNISMERLVVDNLIEGPVNLYPTINPECKVMNVTTKDGVCYVNLSTAFLTKATNVSDETVIYSIVNSLTSLPGINKVQIMIDGETEVSFGSFYLSAPFEGKYSMTE